MESASNVPGGNAVLADDAARATLRDDERERRAIRDFLATAGITGASPAELATATGIDDARTALRIAELLTAGRVRELRRPPALVAADIAEALLARAIERLRERQTERPGLMGVTSYALAQALDAPETALVRVLAGFVEDGRLAYRSGYYSTPGFSPRLSAEQRHFFEAAFAPDDDAARGPRRFAELRAHVRSSAIPELGEAFETLIASGELAKVGEFVYPGAQIAAIRTLLESALANGKGITVAEFRTLTRTSRKYAVPLLGYFDAAGVTRRAGDLRVLVNAETPEHSTRASS